MLRGLANISFYADDLAAAKAWYTEFLGVPPYFTVPGYCEFRIGDYQHEFGLIDKSFAPYGPVTAPGGSITNWHVDDVQATLERLLGLGATELDGLRDRGHGFVTASVIDPFGNILGFMYNPHYVEVLEKTGPY
jgi:catechol 2,3-dioxygenase-like lactoylglutathione lyase family enzyme